MNDIKTVIFDLGGVYFTDGAKAFSKNMEKLYGVPLDKVLAVISGEAGNDYRTGRLSPEQFWALAKKAWDLSIDEKTLSSLWIDQYTPIDGTVDIVDSLRTSYELLFLSDNAPDRVAALEEKYHFQGKFKDGVFSHLVGTRKPDPKIYETALALSSSPAEQCVYIDDKASNVLPAEAFGMKGITFTSPEQLRTDLETLGLKF